MPTTDQIIDGIVNEFDLSEGKAASTREIKAMLTNIEDAAKKAVQFGRQIQDSFDKPGRRSDARAMQVYREALSDAVVATSRAYKLGRRLKRG